MRYLTQLFGAVSVAVSLLAGARLAATELTKTAELQSALEVRAEEPAAPDGLAAEGFEPRADVILVGELTSFDTIAQTITVATNEAGVVTGSFNGDTTFGGKLGGPGDLEAGVNVMIAVSWQEDGSMLIVGVKTVNLNTHEGEPTADAQPAEAPIEQPNR